MMIRLVGAVFLITISTATILVTEDLLIQDDMMEDTIKDVLENLPFEGRGFYESGDAFNTSLAFNIPLLHWNMPGYEAALNASISMENYGMLAFTTILLLAGLGAAIYTTTQGNSGEGIARALETGYEPLDSTIVNVVNNLREFGEILDMQSCPEYAVCNSHAHPEDYGELGEMLRFMFPVSRNDSEAKLNSFQKAALIGHTQTPLYYDACSMTYACLLDPLIIPEHVHRFLSWEVQVTFMNDE